MVASGCGGSSDTSTPATTVTPAATQTPTTTAVPTTTVAATTATPPTTTATPTTLVPTTTLAPTTTTTQVPTATVPAPTTEYQSLCVTSVVPAIPVFEAPAGSTSRRCATSAGNVVFDFTAYPGVLDSLHHDSVGIAVVGHHGCTGNPASRDEQVVHIQNAVRFLRQQYKTVEVTGLWVDSRWDVHEVN